MIALELDQIIKETKLNPSFEIGRWVRGHRDMLPKSKVGKLLRREIRDEEVHRADG